MTPSQTLQQAITNAEAAISTEANSAAAVSNDSANVETEQTKLAGLQATLTADTATDQTNQLAVNAALQALSDAALAAQFPTPATPPATS
jgi:hypothetical protein